MGIQGKWQIDHPLIDCFEVIRTIAGKSISVVTHDPCLSSSNNLLVARSCEWYRVSSNWKLEYICVVTVHCANVRKPLYDLYH
jgi:hypothetical protein